MVSTPTPHADAKHLTASQYQVHHNNNTGYTTKTEPFGMQTKKFYKKLSVLVR